MKNSDATILKKINQVFKQQISDDNLDAKYYELEELYSQLSFTRSYTNQELFPNISPDYKVSDEAISNAKKLTWNARQKWTTGLTQDDPAYFSCREGFKERTGIDIGREYTYPNNMSPQEFQESFSATILPRLVSSAFGEMALAALCLTPHASSEIYNRAFGFKLFLEKEKTTAVALAEKAYHQFWQANSDIAGYEKLKNIEDFSNMRAFLMGVASEIPLDDVEAYLSMDEKTKEEITKNDNRFKKDFHCSPVFSMTDKTWNKHIRPVLEQRKKNSEMLKQRLSER